MRRDDETRIKKQTGILFGLGCATVVLVFMGIFIWWALHATG